MLGYSKSKIQKSSILLLHQRLEDEDKYSHLPRFCGLNVGQ